MHECPYCQKDLGDLDDIMNELSRNIINGVVCFDSKCCQRPLKAYSNTGMYFLIKNDGTSGNSILIGAN